MKISPEKSHKIQITIPHNLYEWLIRHAEIRDQKLPRFIVDIIRDAVEQDRIRTDTLKELNVIHDRYLQSDEFKVVLLNIIDLTVKEIQNNCNRYHRNQR